MFNARCVLTVTAVGEGLLWPGLTELWWRSGDYRFIGLAAVALLTEHSLRSHLLI